MERIGFKGTKADFTCTNKYKFEIGRWYTHEGEIIPCKSGFHLCRNLRDVFSYYYNNDDRYFIVEYGKSYIESGDKIVTNEIRLIMELPDIRFMTEFVELLGENPNYIKMKEEDPKKGCVYPFLNKFFGIKQKELIENGFPICLDQYIHCCFLIHMKNGEYDINTLKYLLEYDIIKDYGEGNTVEQAVYCKRMDILELLHKHGANLSYKNNIAVNIACKMGYIDVLEFLHKNGVDIYANDSIEIACHCGQLEIVKYLVENDPNVVKDSFAICNASEQGHLPIVKYLHEHGADINMNQSYCLRIASEKGHLDAVKYAVEHGADILTTVNGPSALFLASCHHHDDIFAYLKSVVDEKGLHRDIKDVPRWVNDDTTQAEIEHIST